MADQWYYESGGDMCGPVAWDELRRLARDGRIGPTTMLRRGADEWIIAQKAPGVLEGIAEERTPDAPPPRRYDDPRPGPPPRPYDDPRPGPPPRPYDDPRPGPPPRRRDEPPGDEDYAAPRRRGGAAGGVVTAYGIVTLVLAGLLTLVGCVTGVGSMFCFAGSSAFTPPAPSSAPAGAPAPAAAPAAGCGAVLAATFLAIAITLAIVTAVHWLLAGGHITAGVGVLRRRPWARVLALVLSFFSMAYGGYALFLVSTGVGQSGPPGGGPDLTGWLVLTAIVGLLFAAHAVFSWVVMLHPACAGEFRPAAARGRYDRDE